jgi:transposase
MNMIAIDLHVRNSFVHVTDPSGQLLRRGRVGNTLGEIAQFLAPLENQPMRVVMENTTNSRAMLQLLRRYAQDAGVELSAQVLDARKLRVIAESVSKCDRLDAAVLNELARSNLKLPAVYVADDDVFTLREHLRARADLVKVRTMLKNRVHALLHRRGLWTPRADLFCTAGIAWLSEVQLDEAGRQIVERYLAQIRSIDQAIKESTTALSKLAATQRWCGPCAILRTMPGVGLITAMTILAELGDIERFKNRSAVSNYAGLVPVQRDSNNKHYSGHITHRGPAALRCALVEAAWVAVARVPAYRAIHDRVSERRGKQVAIVAVARRMLEDAWTMLKRQQVFRFTCASKVDANASDVANAADVASGSDIEANASNVDAKMEA